MAEQIENLRSERSREKTYIRFINSTQRTVEIIWIDFTGVFVSYQLLNGGAFVDINTYKGHPWIAMDHNTGDRLHIEKNFVYYPKTPREYFQSRYPDRPLPADFRARIIVQITVPLYSLRYASLLVTKNLLKLPEDVDELELPKELVSDLKKVIKQRNNQPSIQTH